MLSILKYVVFFIFSVNISAVCASEIILDIQETPQDMIPVTGRLDLPHPASMRDMMMKSSDSSFGRLLFLGKYFDEKYPGDLINGDFSADVAIIFPELSQQEIYDRTQLIRRSVNLYRWGVKKYTDIRASFLAPKEPPLLLNAEDFDQPQNYVYIEPKDNNFVLVQDFKKALTYGSNPRDVEAREAYQQRLIDSKSNKTAFDKFKSMISKIEFSKIPLYGVSLPSPLVGNAGIGKWQEENGFRVRIISDTATIRNMPQLLAAIHIVVPNHRFILANSLSQNLYKPQITLVDTFNVRDYKVFYPLPIKVANEEMIAAYAGDFAFPIKITTIDPTKPVAFKAEFAFQNCSSQMECQQQTFISDIVIDNGPDNTFSSMQNFVKQSYYNLPKDSSDYLSLQKTAIKLNDDKTIEKILFTFDFKGKIDNFALFVESDKMSRFSTPRISVDRDKIFATVSVLDNTLTENDIITVTVRLNNYTSLRFNTELNVPYIQNQNATTPAWLCFLALCSGLVFILFPLGFACFGFIILKAINSQTTPKLLYLLTIGIFATLNIFVIMLKYYNIKNILFGQQYALIPFLTTAIIILLSVLAAYRYKQILLTIGSIYKVLIGGILIALCFGISGVPFLPQIYSTITTNNNLTAMILVNCIALGVSMPYLLIAVLWNKVFGKLVTNNKFTGFLSVFSLFFWITALVWLLLVVFIQTTWVNFIKYTIYMFACWVIINYLFSFLQALSQTAVPHGQKAVAEKVICIVWGLLLAATIYLTTDYFKYLTDDYRLELENIEQKIVDGKTVIVNLTPSWCISCKLNNYIAFNKTNLKRWQQSYNLEYADLNITHGNKWLSDYMTCFNKYTLPMYVMYNFNLENGLLLPNLINDTDIEQTLDNFKI